MSDTRRTAPEGVRGSGTPGMRERAWQLGGMCGRSLVAGAWWPEPIYLAPSAVVNHAKNVLDLGHKLGRVW